MAKVTSSRLLQEARSSRNKKLFDIVFIVVIGKFFQKLYLTDLIKCGRPNLVFGEAKLLSRGK
ncbi:hypothetical protein M1N54_04445 [Thermodesulfovibrionales bacterium]|nr:hypothetical protein [Thermodesulfovibrionales bacterium]